MANSREDMKRASAEALRSVLEEGAATKKTTVSKKRYTKATDDQTKALLGLARAMQDQLSSIMDVERQEKSLAQARQLSNVKQLSDEEQTRTDVLRQETKVKERAAAQEKALAKARRREEVEQLRNAEQTRIDVLKHEENLRKRKIVQLKGLKGAMIKVLGLQKKLTESSLLAVRNQRLLNTSLATFRSKLLIASFGIALVKKTIDGLIGEYAKYQAAQLRVNSALTSTGFVSGQTVKGLSELASEIQNATGVSDTLTLSSSALLTTFTAIGGETFPTAQKAIVDMTAAMNAGIVTQEGLKSSTIQVGKALNDPIKGITALSRVGVLFTAQQKEQIKNFVNMGKVSKAQAIILKELNKEFGDIASADSYEKSIRKLESSIGDLQKEIGVNLLPIIEGLTKGMSEFVESIDTEDIANWATAIGSVAVVYMGLRRTVMLTTAAMLEGTAVTVALKTALKGLAISSGVGIAIVGLTFLIEKVLEGTGVFDGLSNSVDRATNKFMDLNNAQTTMILGSTELTVPIAATEKGINQLNTAMIMNVDTISKLAVENNKMKKQILDNGENANTVMQGYVKEIALNEERIAQILETVEGQEKLKEQLQKYIELQNTSNNSTLTEQQLKQRTNELSRIENKQLQVKLELYNSLLSSLENFAAQEIDKWNEKEMSKLQSEKERINETVKNEKSKKRQLGDIDKQIEAQGKKHHNKMVTMKLLALAAETAMAIGGIIANNKLAQAKATAMFVVGAAPVIAAIEALQAQQIGATIATNAAQGAILTASYAAKGADFTTTGPQMLMVGDNPGGRERVQVTPLSSPNIAGPQGGTSLTVNVSGNVMSKDYVEGELAEQIKDAIRRGEDFGIS